VEFRTERDSLGEVQVPADALWGAQTQRAVENFPVSGRRLPPAFLSALVLVKRACAEANDDLDPAARDAIRAACDRLLAGDLSAHFPIDVFQTGSGTSTNMNANEVIANLCNPRRGVYAPIHPNDHVNRSQSSNDVIPTAAHVAVWAGIRGGLTAALQELEASLARKAKEFDGVVKLGRTHLMEAVPVRMGQEFAGYAAQVRRGREHLERTSEGLEELAIGGTATGTGLNAPPGFGRRVAGILAARMGAPFRTAADAFEAQGARDDLVRVSGALRALAVALTKIANDVRLMAALGELKLPGLQPGSSIMPGKVNPVMVEMLLQVCAQVQGNDLTAALGGQGGQLELNAMIPVTAAAVLDSIELLTNACGRFARRCIDGLEADARRCAEPLERSPLAATALNPLIGYERATALAKEAAARGVSVKALALEQKLITPEQAETLFDFRRMTGC
jgi:fumarate hydratase class II